MTLICTESSKACLGFQKAVKKKKWIKPATLRAIEGRRNLKKKLFETKSERLLLRYKTQYREADRSLKRMARADKREYIDELASRQRMQLTEESRDTATKSQNWYVGSMGAER